MPQLIGIAAFAVIAWALAGKPSARRVLWTFGLASSPDSPDAADQLEQG